VERQRLAQPLHRRVEVARGEDGLPEPEHQRTSMRCVIATGCSEQNSL
jgi:hypothetical protein